MNTESVENNIVVSTLKAIFLSMGRATAKFFREIPAKVKSFLVIKLNEYKSKPKRDEMNKVYVLVGYTTKQHVENKYRTEHMLISVRRVLLIIIFFEILLISLTRFLPLVDFSQYKNIFGINDIQEMTNNDPFSEEKTINKGYINIDGDN
ncbi:MAG: hypothetical protein MJ153_05435 [Clostridia bacterium]|nr:hypothetical protein [Clostridia bacterium]